MYDFGIKKYIYDIYDILFYYIWFRKKITIPQYQSGLDYEQLEIRIDRYGSQKPFVHLTCGSLAVPGLVFWPRNFN